MNFLDLPVGTGRWIWLSHVLAIDTPAYGGGAGLSISVEKSLACGDSCNTLHLVHSNHLGSHVDAPRHFFDDGKDVTDYPPEEWMFHHPLLLDLKVDVGELVSVAHVEPLCAEPRADTDLVLLRTGMERFRSEETYWRESPGFSADLAPWLLDRFPLLGAIGLDTLSISSLRYREEGRLVHRAFLGRDVRIFEDLALGAIFPGASLESVIALPLRISDGDGAPCSVIAYAK